MAAAKHSNPYETRTKLSLILVIIGGVSVLLLTAGVLRHFDFSEFVAPYRKNSLRFFGILGTFAVSFASSLIGFFLALNCAGQKRNPNSRLAWQTFFLHSAILMISMCIMIVFFFAREELIEVAGGK